MSYLFRIGIRSVSLSGPFIQCIQTTHFFDAVLVVDLIERYDEVLPPTITKKKREVARTIPQRKRTKPFDQRINRRSLQQGDAQGLLKAQHANQSGRQRAGSNVGQRPVAEPPASSTFVEPGQPPRPAFVEPGEPPRPTFVDPGAPPTFAEPSDERPSFAEPQDDDKSGLSVPGSEVVVQPPTPIGGHSENLASPASPDVTSPPREASPSAEGVLSRTPSGTTTRGAIRGPRLAARGPRAPPGASGGAVSPASATHNPRAESRSSVSSVDRPHIAANPSDYAPRGRGGRTNASAFGRKDLATRTMASGSEDETVGK